MEHNDPAAPPESAAFVSNQPAELARKTLDILLAELDSSNLDQREHLLGRLESVFADAITTGATESLRAWSEAVCGRASEINHQITDRRGLTSSELFALRTGFLSDFVARFTTGESVARSVSILLAPKRANWRRALVLLSGANHPWTPRDFEQQVGLKRSAAHSALEALVEQDLLHEHDGGHGKKTYELTPFGWQVAKRLAKQELGTQRSHGDAEVRLPSVRIQIEPARLKADRVPLPDGVMRYSLPQDVLGLLFSDGIVSVPSGAGSCSGPLWHEHSFGRTSWADHSATIREHTYCSWFENGFEQWARHKKPIDRKLEQYCRQQLAYWLPINPVVILDTYHPLLAAAWDPGIIRRLCTIVKKRHRQKADHRTKFVLFMCKSLAPAAGLKLNDSFVTDLVKRIGEITRTLSFNWLPRVAAVHHKRGAIKLNELNLLMDYWGETFRAIYPNDMDVYVKLRDFAGHAESSGTEVIHVNVPLQGVSDKSSPGGGSGRTSVGSTRDIGAAVIAGLSASRASPAATTIK